MASNFKFKVFLFFILVHLFSVVNYLYSEEGSATINIKNADITAVIKIFSKKTKRNYIIDDNVKGKISLFLPDIISIKEANRVLNTILELKGFAQVPVEDNLWKIVPIKDATTSTIPTIVSEKDKMPSSGLITRLLRLKYLSSDEARSVIKPLISKNGLINSYEGTNSLIIIDQADNIKRVINLLKFIDTPFADRQIVIVPIKYADAQNIAEKLEEVLFDKESANTSKAVTSFFTSNRSKTSASSRLKEVLKRRREPRSESVGGKSLSPKIIPDSRTNSIIVVADESTVARVRALISKLDIKANLAGTRFYVYRCKHANAEELAQVLSSLATGTSSSNLSSATTRESGGFSGSSRGSLSNSRRTSSSLSSNSRSRTNRGQGANFTPVSAQLGEMASITADPSTNSLIIYATKDEYEKLLSLLKDLDIKRRQVLVEAILLEVGITDNVSVGTEFLTSIGGKDGGVLTQSSFGGNLAQLLSDPRQLSNLTIAAASAGTLTLPGNITIPTQTALINAVETNQDVNILSAPHILATDNEPAEIVVGQNLPFVASVSTNETNLNNTFNQIEREDVGITLRITPQISSNNFVTLNLYTEVSSVIPSTVGSELGPTTTIRTSETTVIAKDRQMIVIGGLMNDDINNADTGVPFLSHIPLLGHLFKSEVNSRRRNNLLIFITPTIVKDQFDAREASLEKRDVVKEQIIAREITPSRQEVLENNNLNNVIEASPPLNKEVEIIKPSKTIKINKRQKQRKDYYDNKQKSLNSRKNDKENVVNKETAFQPSSFKTTQRNMSFQNKTSQNLYLLLELQGDVPSSQNFPYQLTKNKGKFYLPLILSKDTPTSAKDFFTSRKEVSFIGGSENPIKFRVHLFNKAKGKFSWQQLAPFELLNIGKEASLWK